MAQLSAGWPGVSAIAFDGWLRRREYTPDTYKPGQSWEDMGPSREHTTTVEHVKLPSKHSCLFQDHCGSQPRVKGSNECRLTSDQSAKTQWQRQLSSQECFYPFTALRPRQGTSQKRGQKEFKIKSIVNHCCCNHEQQQLETSAHFPSCIEVSIRSHLFL